jgi:hypothetical protein
MFFMVASFSILSTRQKIPHTTVDIPTHFHEVWWKESKIILNLHLFVSMATAARLLAEQKLMKLDGNNIHSQWNEISQKFCSNISCHIHIHLVERDKPKIILIIILPHIFVPRQIFPNDSDFLGISRSTRCGCCSYQVSSISAWRETCYDHFCVLNFFSILAIFMAT